MKFKTLQNQFMWLKLKPQVCILDSLFPPKRPSLLYAVPFQFVLWLMRWYNHQSPIASMGILLYLVHKLCCWVWCISLVKALLSLNLLISQYGALGYLEEGDIYLVQ